MGRETQDQLQNNIHIFVEQQTKLNAEIVELKTNINYIERIAREKFMMAEPGEIFQDLSDCARRIEGLRGYL